MNTSIEQTDSGVFSIRGELTFDTVSTLLDQSKKLFAGQTMTTVDLAQVTHANSAGLALLLEWLSQSKTSGTKIQFKHIPDALASIADLYNVSGLLPQTGQIVPKKSAPQ